MYLNCNFNVHQNNPLPKICKGKCHIKHFSIGRFMLINHHTEQSCALRVSEAYWQLLNTNPNTDPKRLLRREWEIQLPFHYKLYLSIQILLMNTFFVGCVYQADVDRRISNAIGRRFSNTIKPTMWLHRRMSNFECESELKLLSNPQPACGPPTDFMQPASAGWIC